MSLNTFVSAYVGCALWSSSDEDGESLDAVHTADDIADASMGAMRAECQDFYDAQCDLWRSVYMSDEQAGHDFWLTRNRHGAGFWDRGLGAVGDQLTAFARPYGECDLYIGDDNLVHVA